MKWAHLCRRAYSLFLLLATVSTGAHGQEAKSPLVRIQRGDLPIIISAPHGGQRAVPEVDVRKGEGIPRGASGFVASRDTGTAELATQIADSIAQRFGKQPYFVVADSHRKYLDPNRPAHIAYEDPDAKPVYDAYHDALATFCREVQRRFQVGLLLDVHGQGSARDTVFRGTQDGKTVALLRQRFGESAQTGPDSLFGALQRQGWKVHPNPLDGKEQSGFRGGYIVQSYGGHQGYGIDAIQLEFGQQYRLPENRDSTAGALTEAVAEYARHYLPIKPLAKPSPVDSPADKTPAEKTLAEKPPRIQVAIYRGSGTGASRSKVREILAADPRLSVHDITAEEIRADALDRFQVLLHPGGSGSAQGKALADEGRAKVREFVQAGGGYLGICAGAYLASCDYDWSLHILDAKVIDRAHWNRGFGDVDIRLTSRGGSVLGLDKELVTIYYHQGPLLAPAEDPAVPDFEGLAQFVTEIAKNGAPQGVMPGCTAIAAGEYHQGRVLCFSPHPERTDGLEHILVRGIHWAAQAGKTQARR